MPRPDNNPLDQRNKPEMGRKSIDILKLISGFIAIAFGLWLLWYFRSIVIYIIIAAVISLILTPLKKVFKNIGYGKLRVGDNFASLLSILIFIFVVSSLFFAFIPLVIEQASIISSINYQQINDNLSGPIEQINEVLARFSITQNNEVPFLESLLNQAKSALSFQTGFNFINSVLGFASSFFAAFFSILFVLFFFLRDEDLFENLLKTISPDRFEYKVVNIFSKTKYYLIRYFLGLILQVTLVSIVVTIGMLIIGIENALIIGFFAGIVNLVPYLGPIIGATFGIYVGITTNLGQDFYTEILPMCGFVVLVFFITQMLDNAILSPRIHSSSVKAHPLEIFVVILAAAQIGGAIGMIVGIPAYTILRVFAKEFLSEFKIVRSLTQDI